MSNENANYPGFLAEITSKKKPLETATKQDLKNLLHLKNKRAMELEQIYTEQELDFISKDHKSLLQNYYHGGESLAALVYALSKSFLKQAQTRDKTKIQRNFFLNKSPIKEVDKNRPKRVRLVMAFLMLCGNDIASVIINETGIIKPIASALSRYITGAYGVKAAENRQQLNEALEPYVNRLTGAGANALFSYLELFPEVYFISANNPLTKEQSNRWQMSLPRIEHINGIGSLSFNELNYWLDVGEGETYFYQMWNFYGLSLSDLELRMASAE